MSQSRIGKERAHTPHPPIIPRILHRFSDVTNCLHKGVELKSVSCKMSISIKLNEVKSENI